jgi:uncharacterized membrane protein
MKKNIQILAWFLIIIGCVIAIYFYIQTLLNGYRLWNDLSTTGQFGDFIGGAVGTVFALSGTLFVFLTLYEQIKQNKRETFEISFFEMIHLHRENINEMKYTKYDPNTSEMRTATNRKVFRLIFQEFIDCYHEITRLYDFTQINDYIQPKYKTYLEKIIADKKINIVEFVLIDIVYNIIFFGVGDDGEIILQQHFHKKYDKLLINNILQYIKLKPKRENVERWKIWQTLFEMQDNHFKKICREFCDYKNNLISKKSLAKDTNALIYDKEFTKYYNGHKHRLGHYFQHLFQSYRYISFHNDISDKEKYLYGNIYRSQLSIYEQALLFINSISSLGRKWELTPDVDLATASEKEIENSKLITRFNLIKDLSDFYFFELKYKTYYPNVQYETGYDVDY